MTSRVELDELWKIGEKHLEQAEAEHKLRSVGISDKSAYIWRAFYEKYPNTKGYYQFSRVGFSSGKRVALVSVEGRGSFWNSNTTYFLRKVKGKWAVYGASGGFGIA